MISKITEMSDSKTKKQRHMGDIKLSSNELPEVSSWNIGEKYKITLEVEMTSISKVEDYDLSYYSNISKDDVFARFNIIKAISPSKEQKKKQERLEKQGALKNPVTIKI